MSSATQSDTEHEILTYVHVKERMNLIVKDIFDTPSMIMKKETPLAKALDAMSFIPFDQNSVKVSDDPGDNTLTIAGVEAGTLYNPKVDVILEKSIPSSFGKGSETVLDPSYRSGREIQGENIGFESNIGRHVLDGVQEVMFPSRKVDLKLYKLAVYETGGHFDWHMDSTHSDKHHATLLLALNTSWEGGDLVLRHNNVETYVDLRPQNPAPGSVNLQAVVFFTDTEHRVEPVESGIRIVLQFDVELEKTQEPESEDESEGDQDENKGDQDENEEELEIDEESEDTNFEGPWMDNIGCCSVRMEVGRDAQATRDATLKKVLAIIKKLLNDDTQEVAFALQHLYRKASILGEYLKGSDATLCDALKASGEFDVSLHPVMFREVFDHDMGTKDRYVYRCDAEATLPTQAESDSDSDSDDIDGPPARKKQKRNNPVFHIPELSGIQEISRQDYVERTGNESMQADYRYFGGGMFIRLKSGSSTQ